MTLLERARPHHGKSRLTPIGAGILLLAALLPGGGCVQFHLSDGSGGVYEKGKYFFKTPLRVFSSNPRSEPSPPAAVLRFPGTALFVDKTSHRLLLVVDGKVRRHYEVSFGRGPEGRKLHEGDRRTPEGVYRVTLKKDRGQTRFHRALLINYPNARDVRLYRKAKREGRVPKGRGIGGLIELHGGGTGVDWTDGCIALENEDMDDLFRRVRVGTPVVIVADTSESEPLSPPVQLLSP
jgi:hypothetical protein